MKQLLIITSIILSHICVSAQNDSLPHDYELEEVVVSATRPLSKFDSDGIITTVKGTPLQTLPNINELLGYIPGVSNLNGAIEVVGKGRPLIYINGRKLRDFSELQQIPASKVKTVKVINNPGARYGGDVNAVIRITTERQLGDGFSLDSRATAGIRHYFYTKEFLNLNYRNSGLDIFANGEYNISKIKGSGYGSQNFWGSHKRQVLSNTISTRRKQGLDGKLGLNYSTVSGHTFGAYYQYSYAPTKTYSEALTSFIFSDLKPSVSATSRIENENYYGNLVDAYYSGAWGQWAVDASFDFLWRRDNTDQQICEAFTNSPLAHMGLGDKSKGRMLAGEFHLSKPISKGNFLIGAEYTNSSRSEDFLSNTSSIASVDNKIHESNISVYAQISRTIGRVMLQGGLRYEHINSTYYEDNIRKPEQSASYNEILPSFSLVLPVRKTMFQLSYSRKYNRPGYAQMSSTFHYVDQYTYETGNPDLKNVFTDNVTLNFRYNWLMIMATYKHISNKIITACTEYPNNPDITLLRKENSGNDANNLEFLVSIAPGFIGKFYYPIAMAGVMSQFYSIDFRGSMKHMNSPMFLVRLNNIFRLPKDFLVYANLNYRSSCDGENIHLGKSLQFDLSLSKTINKHWDASLSFNDIFNSARKTSMTIYSGMFEYNAQKYNTLRGIEFSIGYKFNVTRSKYKGNGAGNNEKERF